jgi:hypothetical protein
MPVNLSIKNVPDELVEKLRQRAKLAHRSLQGELMVILEQALCDDGTLPLGIIREKIQSYGVRTPDEATRMIREDRDAR